MKARAARVKAEIASRLRAAARAASHAALEL